MNKHPLTAFRCVLLVLLASAAGCFRPAVSSPSGPPFSALAQENMQQASCIIRSDDPPQKTGAGVLLDPSHGIVLTPASLVPKHGTIRVVFPALPMLHPEAGAPSNAETTAHVAFRDPVRELCWLRLDRVPSGAGGLAIAPENRFEAGQALYSLAATASSWNRRSAVVHQVMQVPHY